MKKNSGITLIALVITVIILVILSAVAVSMITGNDGIFSKANDSATRYNEAAQNEAEIINGLMELTEEKIDKTGGSWNEKKGVNSPKIEDGIIPIKWNGTNWVVCATNDDDWYEYVDTSVSGNANTSKWANMMLSDGTYKYDTVQIGQVVQTNELGSMFVWIPRYAYCINSGYHTKNQGTIDIEFLKNTSSKSSVENRNFNNIIIEDDGSTTIKTTGVTVGNGAWLVHPAFLNNATIGGWDKELPGIWVAKFKASSTTPTATNGGADVLTSDILNIKILPNVNAWRNTSEVNTFKNCLAMNRTGNIYGLSSNSEPHQMKNSEWGALAYLTHSKYGKNAANIDKNFGQVTGDGNYISKVTESTTGNIYGVYDVVGGQQQTMAAGLGVTWINNNLGTIPGFQEKYVNKYTAGYSATYYGDAIYETSSSANAWGVSWFSGGYEVTTRGNLISRAHWDTHWSSSYGSYPTMFSAWITGSVIEFRPTIVI